MAIEYVRQLGDGEEAGGTLQKLAYAMAEVLEALQEQVENQQTEIEELREQLAARPVDNT